jgi:hypothetical protein
MLSDKSYLKGIENGKYARGTGLVANFIGNLPDCKHKKRHPFQAPFGIDSLNRPFRNR